MIQRQTLRGSSPIPLDHGDAAKHLTGVFHGLGPVVGRDHDAPDDGLDDREFRVHPVVLERHALHELVEPSPDHDLLPGIGFVQDLLRELQPGSRQSDAKAFEQLGDRYHDFASVGAHSVALEKDGRFPGRRRVHGPGHERIRLSTVGDDLSSDQQGDKDDNESPVPGIVAAKPSRDFRTPREPRHQDAVKDALAEEYGVDALREPHQCRDTDGEGDDACGSECDGGSARRSACQVVTSSRPIFGKLVMVINHRIVA